VDVEVWRLESGTLAGRGRGWSGDGPKARARSRGPGLVQLFLFLFLSDQGDVWVEGGEASSAGHGQEAGKTGSCIYAMAAKRPYAI
jgi:hypothetical protein